MLHTTVIVSLNLLDFDIESFIYFIIVLTAHRPVGWLDTLSVIENNNMIS